MSAQQTAGTDLHGSVGENRGRQFGRHSGAVDRRRRRQWRLCIGVSMSAGAEAANNTVGGSGSAGGSSGSAGVLMVDVTNHGAISTNGRNSSGIVAQSIGGGGGNGGFAIAATATVSDAKGSAQAIGGKGSVGNTSGDVHVTNVGNIITAGICLSAFSRSRSAAAAAMVGSRSRARFPPAARASPTQPAVTAAGQCRRQPPGQVGRHDHHNRQRLRRHRRAVDWRWRRHRRLLGRHRAWARRRRHHQHHGRYGRPGIGRRDGRDSIGTVGRRIVDPHHRRQFGRPDRAIDRRWRRQWRIQHRRGLQLQRQEFLQHHRRQGWRRRHGQQPLR